MQRIFFFTRVSAKSTGVIESIDSREYCFTMQNSTYLFEYEYPSEFF